MPRALQVLNFARAEFAIVKFCNSKIPLEQIYAITKFAELKFCRLGAVLPVSRRNLMAKFNRAAAA